MNKFNSIAKQYLTENESSPFGWAAEAVPHLKEGFTQIESIGYSGDAFSDEQKQAVVQAVLGSSGNWGDEYESLVNALELIIRNYYERGLQDS